MEGERPAPPPPASRRNVMVLSSPAFENGEAIPLKHARAGENASPPLVWTAAPPGARSFALAVVDVHPVARNYVHWLVAGLGPDVSSIAEGASGSRQMPPGSRELKAYVGPFPPSGSHDYESPVRARDGRARPARQGLTGPVHAGRGAEQPGHGRARGEVHASRDEAEQGLRSAGAAGPPVLAPVPGPAQCSAFCRGPVRGPRVPLSCGRYIADQS
jgi:phosphatidylethanolamine-binding protein (PEBP) family uncharacterized protein